MKAHARAQCAAGVGLCWRGSAEKSGRMDSMEVNKSIAAILVVGIVFFLTGLIGDNLVYMTPPAKPALDIKVAATAAPGAEANKPEPLQPIGPLLASADTAAGGQFVKQVCAVCHTFNEGGKPAVGPNLYGIVGAPHAHEAGFNYSDAIEKFKGQPWTYEALNEWLFKPSQYAPGTRMTFVGIPSEKQRANVIAFLRTLSHNPVPLPSAQAAAPAAKPAPAQETTAPAAGQPATGAPTQTPPPANSPASAPAAPPAASAPNAGSAPQPATPSPAPPKNP
jgi:cytochrome c